MEDRIKLKPGEQFRLDDLRAKGTLGETEILTLSIINEAGLISGFAVYTDHTAIKGNRRTESLIQKDLQGNVVVEEQW